MSLTNMQRQWQHAAKHFNLMVEMPFVVKLPDGRAFEAEVLVRGYGAWRGTLVLSDFSKIASVQNEIMAAGYTISSYSQPSEEEIRSLVGFQEMLNDWGTVVSKGEDA